MAGRTATLAVRIVGDASGATRAFAQVDRGLSDTQSAAKRLALPAAAATAAVTAIGVASVKVASSFEQTMASMQVNAGATAGEMDDLRQLAVRMGADTVFSANEAAVAMLELSKSGMKPAEIQGGALAATMNLAATEGMDLARAGTIMAQAMNTYGIAASDSARVTDVLAAGAVASTAGVEDLASGLKYVGSTSAAMNISLEDSTTALAALNNAGLDASTAGTSLNRFLLGISAPSKTAKKGFEELGLSMTDAAGNMLPMQDAIAELDAAVTGLAPDEKAAMLKQMFGVEGMRAANILLAEGADGWAALSEEVTKAGVAQEMADARMSGTAGAMERMQGSIETAMLAIGTAMAPVVTAVADGIGSIVDLFTRLPAGAQTAVVAVVGMAVAAGAMTVAITKAVAVYRDLRIIMTAVNVQTIAGNVAMYARVAALTAMVVAQYAFAAASAVASAAATALGAAMTIMLGPVGLIILAIAAAIAIGVLLWKNWDKVTAAIGAAWEWLKATATAVWNAIVAAVTAAINEVRNVIRTVLTAIKAVIDFYLNVWLTIFRTVWNAIVAAVTGHINAVKAVISTVIETIKTIIRAGLDVVKALFRGDFGAIPGIVGKALGDVLKLVGDLPHRIVAALGDLGRLLYDKGRQLVQGLIDGIKSLAGSVGGVIGKLIPGGKSAPMTVLAPMPTLRAAPAAPAATAAHPGGDATVRVTEEQVYRAVTRLLLRGDARNGRAVMVG